MDAIRDINKMINIHQRFYHNERSLDNKLGEYYLLKAKAKALFTGYQNIREDLLKSIELGNELAKEIFDELENS